ncbi:MAG: hypothetical protein LCH54_13255 [Bacteroidetes bacterium]|nr:hypothetical protein [Bacteroidota bacterium]
MIVDKKFPKTHPRPGINLVKPKMPIPDETGEIPKFAFISKKKKGG